MNNSNSVNSEELGRVVANAIQSYLAPRTNVTNGSGQQSAITHGQVRTFLQSRALTKNADALYFATLSI